MVAPKPGPHAGDFGSRTKHGPQGWYHNYMKCSSMALWGTEWAAVAWMALAAQTLNESHLSDEGWVVGAIWDQEVPFPVGQL